MRIGLLGGSFDPPHIGHLLAASDAYEALSLDRVVFVPASVQPLKAGRVATDPAHLALFALSIAGAWILTFFIFITIGSLSFFLEKSIALAEVYFGLFMVLSGYLVPLELMPAWCRAIAEALPFRYMLGAPVEILTGAHTDAAAGNAKAKAAADTKPKTKEPPIYVELGDAFVVNFNDGNRTRYLQVRIEAMTRDPAISTAINTHLPRIRNNLVFLLSSVTYDQISTLEGKQKLRADTLTEIQKVLKEKIGKPGVEEVYFTSIVMQ